MCMVCRLPVLERHGLNCDDMHVTTIEVDSTQAVGGNGWADHRYGFG